MSYATRKWHCGHCGKSTNSPIEKYLYDDGASYTPLYLCPECGSQLEELEQCPACYQDYMHHGDNVCEKCHLRIKGELSRFLRQFVSCEIAELNDMTEGCGLEEFR